MSTPMSNGLNLGVQEKHRLTIKRTGDLPPIVRRGVVAVHGTPDLTVTYADGTTETIPDVRRVSEVTPDPDGPDGPNRPMTVREPDDDEDDAPRALFCEAHERSYEDECPECPVWTIFGHWENDRLVMDAVVQGEHEDMRERDDETYPEGLWCDSASAPSWEEAFDLLREHYEATDPDEGE